MEAERWQACASFTNRKKSALLYRFVPLVAKICNDATRCVQFTGRGHKGAGQVTPKERREQLLLAMGWDAGAAQVTLPEQPAGPAAGARSAGAGSTAAATANAGPNAISGAAAGATLLPSGKSTLSSVELSGSDAQKREARKASGKLQEKAAENLRNSSFVRSCTNAAAEDACGYRLMCTSWPVR